MSTTPNDIETRVKALEAKATTEESKVWTWVKSNLGHFISWAGIAYTILKHL